MAKGGGGKKRTYVRDSNGRFASSSGSAAKSTSSRASTLGARTGLKDSKAKLKAKDKADQTLQNTLSTRAQKGAVKRGNRRLAAAKVAAQARISGGRKGVIGKPKGLRPGALTARKKMSGDEPVVVQKATIGKGYKISPRPTARPTAQSSSSQPSKPKTPAKPEADSGKKVEKRIASIVDRRVSRSASPEKQFKSLQTQKRAAEYLRAASKFAERKNISLSKALRSGPKNSTKPKKSRSRKPQS
jgi:hypothetical protein